jgi:hypothetical protein
LPSGERMVPTKRQDHRWPQVIFDRIRRPCVWMAEGF